MAYSLGEAIGLQGRFDIAEKTAGAGIAATNARIKEAQKRAQEDEAAYRQIRRNIKTDNTLNHLFINPAGDLTAHALDKLAEARANGNTQDMYNIESDFIEDMSKLQQRSAVWDAWEKNYNNTTNYKRKDQRDLYALATGAYDYLDLGRKVDALGIPGYDTATHQLTGSASTFSTAINTTKVLDDRMRQIRLTESKPVTVGDTTTQMKYVFLTDAQANQFAKEQGLTSVPVSIESEVKNLLLNDPAFFNQYSDEQNTTDINALFKTAFADASKFAQKQIDESKESDQNIAIYNTPSTTPMQVNLGINREIVNSISDVPNFGSHGIPLPKITSFVPPMGTVNQTGSLQTETVADVTPQGVVILPTRIKGEGATSYNAPLMKGANETGDEKLKLNSKTRFEVYVKMTTGSKTLYVPATAFTSSSYFGGNEATRINVTQAIDLLTLQKEKLNKFIKTNGANTSNKLYTLYNAYLANPAKNAPALNDFLNALP